MSSESFDPTNHSPPPRAAAELAMIVLSRQPLETVLGRIAALAVTDIQGVDEASITLVRDERPFTAAFTGDLAMRLDERQYATGSGPCVDAALSGTTIEILDTTTAATYPDFTPLAEELGVLHTVSVGLPATTGTPGSLNLYGLQHDRSGGTRTEAQVFAPFAAVALTNAVELSDASRLAERMQRGAGTRASIQMAKGILMREHRCTPDEAMTMLIAAADRSGRKLREIAATMVEDVRVAP